MRDFVKTVYEVVQIVAIAPLANVRYVGGNILEL